MIRDFRAEKPGIAQFLNTGHYVLIFVLRKHELLALDKCYRTIDILKEQFNLLRHEIVMFGDTNPKPSAKMMKVILDTDIVKYDGEERDGYTCFENLTRQEAMHLNPIDSYKCIYHKLIKPKYMLVLKIKAESKKQFKI